jgi:hypothetical protein
MEFIEALAEGVPLTLKLHRMKRVQGLWSWGGYKINILSVRVDFKLREQAWNLYREPGGIF